MGAVRARLHYFLQMQSSRTTHTKALRRRLIVAALAIAVSPLAAQAPVVNWSESPVVTDARLETVIDGLNRPWSVAWLPDGGLLITQRNGTLLYFSDAGAEPQRVAGVPRVFAQGQGGLLDVVLHPQFSQNRWVYFSYSAGTRSANRTEVARYRFDDGSLRDGQVVFRVNADKSGSQHFGSRLAWLPDGTLLISIGDGGNPPLQCADGLQRDQAQEPETLFGAIARINADGSVPADNPFVGDAGVQPQMYSIGHRNVQGIVVDPSTGAVWATEHGSRGADEMNAVRAGANYGWPRVSHTREYRSGALVSPDSSLPGFEDPRLVWLETVAPSGLALRDRMLYAGGLRSQAVHEITLASDGSYSSQRVIPIGARVRDVRVGPDGALYVLTDEERTGRLIRVTLR